MATWSTYLQRYNYYGRSNSARKRLNCKHIATSTYRLTIQHKIQVEIYTIQVHWIFECILCTYIQYYKGYPTLNSDIINVICRQIEICKTLLQLDDLNEPKRICCTMIMECWSYYRPKCVVIISSFFYYSFTFLS